MASATAPSTTAPAHKGSRLFGYRKEAYLYLLPAFFFYTGFVIVPALRTLYTSFFSTSGITIIGFVGLQNYRALFADPLFRESVLHNFAWTAIVIGLPTSFGLVLAVLLAQARLIGRTFFRTILFLPQVIKSVVVAMIWRWMYHPTFGPVNEILRAVGLGSVARGWLGDSTWALPALAIGRSWAHYGFCMVIFLAALQCIDEQLYDAAKIDGANTFEQFRFVTLPAIKFAIVTVLLFTLIDCFKVFDMIWIATEGGPGYSTWVMSIYLYDYVWFRWKLGLGVASAVVHSLWIAALTAGMLAWRRRVEESER